MQTVFASIWDYHTHKSTVLEQKNVELVSIVQQIVLIQRKCTSVTRCLRKERAVYGFGKLPWKRLGEAVLVLQVRADCNFYFVDPLISSLDSLFQCFFIILNGVIFLNGILDLSGWHLSPLLVVVFITGKENRFFSSFFLFCGTGFPNLIVLIALFFFF